MWVPKVRSAPQLKAAVKGNCIRAVSVDANSSNDTQNLKSWKDIPGPTHWPIVGQLPTFLPGGMLYKITGKQFGDTLFNTYGPIVRLDGMLGRPNLLALFDPDTAAHVLRSENWLPVRPGFQSLDYYRKEYGKVVSSDYKGKGLLTDYGDQWKEFRSTVNPVLLQPKTIMLYNSMLDKVAQEMVQRLKSLRDSNNTIQSDFEMEMNLWSLESIALVVLGRRLGCFDRELPPDSPEKKLIQIVHDIFTAANELDFKPNLWRYYPTKRFKKAMKLYEEQELVAKYFVDKTIEEIEKRGQKSDDEQSVLEKLLAINKDVAIIMASDSLFAGVDTTSNTITATLYLLAKNQDKQDRLREEILQTSPNDKRPYLKACLKESLRTLPVVSGNIRLATKDYNLLGYRIPKGTHITMMHQTMAMMEDQYPRAKEYLPERWLAKKGDPLYHGIAHPFANQPFGFGVRSCIGRRIAELEMETFLGRLIEKFHVEWRGEPLQVKSTSLNYTEGPYNFIFNDA